MKSAGDGAEFGSLETVSTLVTAEQEESCKETGDRLQLTADGHETQDRASVRAMALARRMTLEFDT
jgi:hypothetical protein